MATTTTLGNNSQLSTGSGNVEFLSNTYNYKMLAINSHLNTSCRPNLGLKQFVTSEALEWKFRSAKIYLVEEKEVFLSPLRIPGWV